MSDGATYPKLPACEKFRAKARAAGSIADMAPADVEAYGQAVLAGILTLQRAEGARALPPASAPHCASGTAHTDGAKILSAIRTKLAAALDAGARADRARRTDEEICDAYAEAMKAKRAAEAAAIEVAKVIEVVAEPVAAAAPAPARALALVTTANQAALVAASAHLPRAKPAKAAKEPRATAWILPPHKPFAPAIPPAINRRKAFTVRGGAGFIARA